MLVGSRQITVAHSPDSDDAFMFYAIAHEKLNTEGLKFVQITKDIQTLNQEALKATYDVTAISFAVYPRIANSYYITTCGASMGADYGPVVIAKRSMTEEELSSSKVAIPGKLTTAYLCLQLYQPKINVVEMPFDQIIDAVASGSVDAGLLIHEGQLTFASRGLKKIVDLGHWWHSKTGLPLPLGANVIKRDLGREVIEKTTKIIQKSIVYGIKHKREALKYAMSFARDMDPALAERYIDMYVNELTVDCGRIGRKSVEKLFSEAFEKGILAARIVPEFVG